MRGFEPLCALYLDLILDGSFRYMAEFPDFSVWQRIRKKISKNDHEIWFGFVAIDNQAWWSGGREVKSMILIKVK